MKLIEAMKGIKRLTKKVHDLRGKIAQQCAQVESVEPEYGSEQKTVVTGWVQACVDTIAEIAKLRMAITRTNLETSVTVEIDGKAVSNPIAHWVLRRRELAELERSVWSQLGDRGLQPQAFKQPDETVGVHQVVRFYDVGARDKKLAALRDEPALIDAALEMANATTDLIE